MEIGDFVKVIHRSRARFGVIGRIIGREFNMLGMMFRVRFGEEDGLYSKEDLQVVDEGDIGNDPIGLY